MKGVWAFAAICAACGTTVQTRTRLVDEQRRPIAGAVFLIETIQPGTPPRLVSFELAQADADGWAPPRSSAPLRVEYPAQACELAAVFAPERPPYIVSNRPPCPRPRHDVSEGEWTVAADQPSVRPVTEVYLPAAGDGRREALRQPWARPVRAALRAAGRAKEISDLPDP